MIAAGKDRVNGLQQGKANGFGQVTATGTPPVIRGARIVRCVSRVDAVCVNLGGTARAYSLLSQEKSGTGVFYFVKPS